MENLFESRNKIDNKIYKKVLYKKAGVHKENLGGETVYKSKYILHKIRT